MKYLTLDQLIFVNDAIISASGGLKGIRNLDLLHSSCERPKASFAGNDLYATVFEKAAALIHSLILNHPFADGNKRTGLICTLIFLQLNGAPLSITQKEAVFLTTWIEEQKPSIDKIAAWLTRRRP